MKNNSERILNRQISARILNLITDKSITPYQLMKDLDLPKASFYNCMNSERDWSIDNLIKLAEYFNVSLDYLIKGPILDEYGTHLENKQRIEDIVYKIKKLEEEKQQLEEENRHLRDSISQITALTKAVEVKKKLRQKRKK